MGINGNLSKVLIPQVHSLRQGQLATTLPLRKEDIRVEEDLQTALQHHPELQVPVEEVCELLPSVVEDFQILLPFRRVLGRGKVR